MLTHNHRHHHSHMAPSLFSLFFTLFLATTAFADSHNETLPPTPFPTQQQHYYTTFKPGIAIIIAVLTLFFSLTFILLLYIKHCTGDTITTTTTGGGILFSSSSRDLPPSTRKNSGVDRSVVESLPIFRFGSLTGQKDGLDCAVCLNKFDAVDVLRLLPKCKHAFHVECVDTWLDAHSTCPLCRYRVDPEDILLVLEDKNSKKSFSQQECLDIEKGKVSVSVGESKRRPSSEGEKEWERSKTASFRWSLDSRKKNEVVGIGISCFVRPPRKDGMLLTREKDKEERISVERRLEHRIIVSPTVSGVHRDQRWSDVQPCDLLYLTSEMIISEARGRGNKKKEEQRNNNDERWKGRRGIINSRSVSEITGLSRFPSSNRNNKKNCMEREEGLVSRWLAWISNYHSQTDVR